MIIRQTLLYLPAQLVGPLFQFVAVLAWTHWLQAADYGFIALLFALQELAFTLCMSWWTQYTVRYLPGLADRTAYERGESAAMVVAAITQVPVVLAAMALTGHLDSAALALATLAFTLSRTLNTHLGERARALGDVLTYTIVQTAGPVLGFGLGFLLMEAWPGALAVVAGFAIVQIAILPLLASRLDLRPRASLRIDATLLRAAIAYGGPLLAAGGFGWLCLNGIRLVVEWVDGIAAVGLLSVGWNLGQRLISVVAMLVTAAAFPLAVRQSAQGGRQAGIAQIGRSTLLVLALLLPACVGLVAVARPFTELFVGAEFREATLIVLPLAALAAAIRNLRMHSVDQVFMIAEEPHFLLILNVAEAAGTVALCALGLAWGGLAGACLGTLAATTASTLACFAVAVTRHGFVIPLGAVLRIAAVAAAMAVVIRLDIYPPGAWGLTAQVAAGALIYLGLAALALRGPLASGAALLSPAARTATRLTAAQLAQQQDQERRVGARIAHEQTPRLLRQPEGPFESRPLDQARRAPDLARDDVERAPDPHHERHAEPFAVAQHEALLARRRHRHEQAMGAALRDRPAQVRLLRGREIPVMAPGDLEAGMAPLEFPDRPVEHGGRRAQQVRTEALPPAALHQRLEQVDPRHAIDAALAEQPQRQGDAHPVDPDDVGVADVAVEFGVAAGVDELGHVERHVLTPRPGPHGAHRHVGGSRLGQDVDGQS